MALLLSLIALQWAHAQSTACYDPMAHYRPASNVTQHSFIDLDMRDIDTLVDAADWSGANSIYTNGKYSRKTTGMRKIRDFSTTAPTLMAGQTMYEKYKAYYDSGTYGDEFVASAFAGTGDFVGVTDVARGELIIKAIQYQIVWMYVIRELEDAVDDCQDQTATRNDAGVLAWDEAWAFYAGSLEGKNGTDNGYSLYTLAEKRCAQFGTCDNKGMAKANVKLLGLFAQGQALLNVGDCSGAATVLTQITSLMTVPLVQGAMRYMHRGVSNTGWSGTTTSFTKERAEGWAFASAFLPQVHACNPSVATALKNNMFFKASPYMTSGATNLWGQLQSVLPCMGVKCADVGTMTEGSTVILPACVDPPTSGAGSDAAQRHLSKVLAAVLAVALFHQA